MSDGTDAEVSDEALCRRIAGGDERAFDLLVTRWQGRAYRLAWSILRDVEDARDVSQDAFVRLYQTAGGFREQARFSTWFYRILVNLCLDHRRRGRWWRGVLGWGHGGTPGQADEIERVPAPDDDAARRAEDAQAVSRLWRAVDALAPRQRATVLLHVQEGLATSEIAAVLGCSDATVRVHLHRAVATLRKTLKEG